MAVKGCLDFRELDALRDADVFSGPFATVAVAASQLADLLSIWPTSIFSNSIYLFPGAFFSLVL